MEHRIKLLYIYGISHSGSTVLDMVLSYYPGSVGLGETYSLYEGKNQNLEKTGLECSCGAELKDCSFWKTQSIVQKGNQKPKKFQEGYTEILKQVQALEKEIIIDSSKKMSVLEEILELEKDGLVDVKVIHIVKDFRSYMQSMRNLFKRHNRFARPHFLMGWRWYKQLKQMEKYLDENKIDHIQVSYEKFCFQTKEVLKEIADFADLDVNNFTFLNTPCSHVMFGNRTKKRFGGLQDIVYSKAWMYNYPLILTSIIAFPLYIASKKRYETITKIYGGKK